MRLVVTVPWGERLGGAEEMLWTILRHLGATSLEPTLVFLQAGAFEREVAGLGLPTAVVPSGRLRDPRATARTVHGLAAILRRERPRLLVNWSPKTQLYGAPAAALAGMRDRVVWWQHGIPDVNWLDRTATLLPTRAVGCSSHASARAQERLRPRRPTFVVHPGIEPPDAVEPAGLALPEGEVVVGIVGRLQPWKRQHLVLEAVAELRRRGHRVHALVVGGDAYDLSPEYGPALRRLAADLGIGDAVTFTGQVADALPSVARMDVLVNASQREPFGIVLLEAMALGVPVVAYAEGGPLEIVEPERTGVLVPPDGDLALALEPLVADTELRRRLGREARTSVLARFGARETAMRLERELEAICG